MQKEKLYIDQLKNILEPHRDIEKAAQMKAYLKNHFDFLGISKPQLTALTKDWYLEVKNNKSLNILLLICVLWQEKEREYQHIALDLLIKNKKNIKEQDLPHLERLIISKSWWDTVDMVATHAVGTYFSLFPHRRDDVIEQWNASDNLWLIRTSIIFQLKYKDKTDSGFLSACIVPHLKSKEFFIQKAIGWALREYSQIDPLFVKSFVSLYEMAPLSKREALRKIS